MGGDHPLDTDYDPVSNHLWEKQFAWKPVRVHGKFVWLKTVYVTHEWNHDNGLRWVKKYGTILDVLKDIQ